MDEQAIEEMESSAVGIEHGASGCPMHRLHAQRASVDADDELILPKHKRVVTRYSTDAGGATQLHLYYGEKEISFDEPELFGFGEGLAKQSRFVAKTATTWGVGYDWLHVRELLEQLIEEGILRHANADEAEPATARGVSPSPLPPALTTEPRTWF